jgi:uroporphyrinogen-III synthase
MREVVKVEKKAKILNAAAVLFSRKNYHEVMIEEVAKLASIAKGTVYNYFDSKEDIYFSIMLERMDNLINSLDVKIKAGRDSKNALEAFVLHLYSFMKKYQDFFLMYRRETLKAENQLCDKITKMQKQLRSMLKDIIIDGIECKMFRNIDAGFASDLILGSIYASVVRGIENNFNENEILRERAETFNFIYEGMSADSGVLPLKGKTIILTRTEEQNRESSVLFEQSGAVVFSFPAIKIIPVDNSGTIGKIISESPDYLVLTSVNAVKIFSDQLQRSGKTISQHTKVAVVGNKTASECRSQGINPDVIPRKQSAEGLIEYFNKIENLEGKKILLPRSSGGREELINYLESRKAVVHCVDIYNTGSPSKEELSETIVQLFTIKADAVVFASPSAVKNFLQLTGSEGADFLRKTNIASIGSTTSSELQASGFTVKIQPEEFSLEGIRDSIIDFFNKEKE